MCGACDLITSTRTTTDESTTVSTSTRTLTTTTTLSSTSISTSTTTSISTTTSTSIKSTTSTSTSTTSTGTTAPTSATASTSSTVATTATAAATATATATTATATAAAFPLLELSCVDVKEVKTVFVSMGATATPDTCKVHGDLFTEVAGTCFGAQESSSIECGSTNNYLTTSNCTDTVTVLNSMLDSQNVDRAAGYFHCDKTHSNPNQMLEGWIKHCNMPRPEDGYAPPCNFMEPGFDGCQAAVKQVNSVINANKCPDTTTNPTTFTTSTTTETPKVSEITCSDVSQANSVYVSVGETKSRNVCKSEMASFSKASDSCFGDANSVFDCLKSTHFWALLATNCVGTVAAMNKMLDHQNADENLGYFQCTLTSVCNANQECDPAGWITHCNLPRSTAATAQYCTNSETNVTACNVAMASVNYVSSLALFESERGNECPAPVQPPTTTTSTTTSNVSATIAANLSSFGLGSNTNDGGETDAGESGPGKADGINGGGDANADTSKTPSPAGKNSAVKLVLIILLSLLFLSLIFCMVRRRRIQKMKEDALTNPTYEVDPEAAKANAYRRAGVEETHFDEKPNRRKSRAISARQSSFYEAEVASTMSALEREAIAAAMEQWVEENPTENPNTSMEWQAVEAEVRRQFKLHFTSASEKRKTFHEEEQFEGFDAVGGVQDVLDNGDQQAIDTLEMQLEQALEEAENKARAAEEAALAAEQEYVAAVVAEERPTSLMLTDPMCASLAHPPLTIWHHGPLSKPESHELLLANGGSEHNGKFLLRTKPNSSEEHILSVIYKGKPSHHLLKLDPATSVWKYNGTKCGPGTTTLLGVVEYLQNRLPKWPVPLTEGVLYAEPPPPPPEPEPESVVAPTPDYGSPPASPTGRPPTVDYGDSDDEDGNAAAAATTKAARPNLDEPIAEVPSSDAKKQPSWMQEAKQKRSDTDDTGASSAAAAAGGTLLDDDGDTDGEGSDIDVDVAVASLDQPPRWLHVDLQRKKAGVMVMADGTKTGTFLIRGFSDKPNSWWIVVQYKGKATHHLVERTADGAPLLVNKKALGSHTTIKALVGALDHAQKGWPVALHDPILLPEPEPVAAPVAVATAPTHVVRECGECQGLSSYGYIDEVDNVFYCKGCWLEYFSADEGKKVGRWSTGDPTASMDLDAAMAAVSEVSATPAANGTRTASQVVREEEAEMLAYFQAAAAANAAEEEEREAAEAAEAAAAAAAAAAPASDRVGGDEAVPRTHSRSESYMDANVPEKESSTSAATTHALQQQPKKKEEPEAIKKARRDAAEAAEQHEREEQAMIARITAKKKADAEAEQASKEAEELAAAVLAKKQAADAAENARLAAEGEARRQHELEEQQKSERDIQTRRASVRTRTKRDLETKRREEEEAARKAESVRARINAERQRQADSEAEVSQRSRLLGAGPMATRPTGRAATSAASQPSLAASPDANRMSDLRFMLEDENNPAFEEPAGPSTTGGIASIPPSPRKPTLKLGGTEGSFGESSTDTVEQQGIQAYTRELTRVNSRVDRNKRSHKASGADRKSIIGIKRLGKVSGASSSDYGGEGGDSDDDNTAGSASLFGSRRPTLRKSATEPSSTPGRRPVLVLNGAGGGGHDTRSVPPRSKASLGSTSAPMERGRSGSANGRVLTLGGTFGGGDAVAVPDNRSPVSAARKSSRVLVLGESSGSGGSTTVDDYIADFPAIGLVSGQPMVQQPQRTSPSPPRSSQSPPGSLVRRRSKSSRVPMAMPETVQEIPMLPTEEWAPPKDSVDHAAEEQERFRREAIAHTERTAARSTLLAKSAARVNMPIDSEPAALEVYYGASDEIAELATRATKSTDNRTGKYFDAHEGPRESMAVGRRPSVRDILNNRRGQIF